MNSFKKTIIRLLKNVKYLITKDLYDNELEMRYYLTEKIIEDLYYEYEENKNLIKNLNVLDEYETVELLLKNPKSFCRFGDGEIKLIQGIDQGFQNYNKELADRLISLLSTKQNDIYIGINRAYFHSPLVWNERNKKFYRLYGTEFRRFFIKICPPENTYIDAGFLGAYYRFGDDYNYERHYENMLKLFENKKIAVVCGEGILEKLSYDVFERSIDKIIIHGPVRNAYDKYDKILKKIMHTVPKDYTICLILGMTAKVLVGDLTKEGYLAWDVGHLAQDYNVYKLGLEKNEKNMNDFWAPD